jgi:predicted small secreted protein
MTSRIKARGATSQEKPWLALLSAVLLASTLTLSACNTAKGIGDDAEEAAEEVEDAID